MLPGGPPLPASRAGEVDCSRQSLAVLAEELVKNLEAFAAGQPINVANPEVLARQVR